MRTITVEVNLYSVDDLYLESNSEIRAKVLREHRYINVDDVDWDDIVLTNCKMEMEKLGFKNIKTEFSLSYSQGDGARILGSIAFRDAIKIIPIHTIKGQQLLRRYLDEITDIKLTSNSSRYFHESTIQLEYPLFPTDPKIYESVHHVAEGIYKFVFDKSIALHQELMKEYDYLIDDTQVLNTLQANGYEFTTDGKIY